MLRATLTMDLDAKRLRETEAFLYEQIPLTHAMGVQVESYNASGLTLSAPLAQNHNHLGTAFGGSLAALAMLAGYSLLWLELGDREAHIVLSESSLKFRKPVRGTLRAISQRPAIAALELFRSDFATKGKARIELQVLIETEGETTAEFKGTYVARSG